MRATLNIILIGVMAGFFGFFGCSMILDTEELTSNGAAEDGAQKDAASPDGPDKDGQPVTDKTVLPPDKAGCVPDAKCTVGGQLGRCSIGTSSCFDSGSGTCIQVNQPFTESCNGNTNPVFDRDCDGVTDDKDPDAHESCGTGKYCNGTSCANGCWQDSQCKSETTDRCHTNHQCRCGTSSPCSQPNPFCLGGKCACDANSVCRSQETCQGGFCYCGSAKGNYSGPFCPSGTICNPIAGACVSLTDGGPDQLVPDQSVPDQSVPDQSVPDQSVPDQLVPDQQPVDAGPPDQPSME